jgi:uncharacterized linocin/CFP29 family protein
MNVNPIEVQKHLAGVDYPATRDELADTARRNGAQEDVVQAISELRDEQFDGPDTLMERLGGE